MTEVTLQDARARLGQLLTRASHTGETIAITRYGKPEGVIISAEAYAELQELRREKDKRDLLAAVEADRRGELDWIHYPATTHDEQISGLNTALGIDE